jgi:hypothetical protein
VCNFATHSFPTQALARAFGIKFNLVWHTVTDSATRTADVQLSSGAVAVPLLRRSIATCAGIASCAARKSSQQSVNMLQIGPLRVVRVDISR